MSNDHLPGIFFWGKKRMYDLRNYHSGLSGLNLPIPKYQFPEEHRESSRLRYYSTFFNSIEINSSFYRLPLQRTILKWMDEVPDDFSFTFKLWQEITHTKGNPFKHDDVKRFFDAISVAGNKKGALLIQFPPSNGISSMPQLSELLEVINECNTSNNWKIAVEFRNKSWYEDKVCQLLEAYHATLVRHDIPKSRTPVTPLESEHIYLRFHGPTGNYRGTYEDDVLREYAVNIREWLEDDKKVFVYFNNTMGTAFTDLQKLNSFLK